jgi:hypothetical protein
LQNNNALKLFYCLMKKLAAISLIALLLFTGIRLNVATHYCCGHVAGTKISLTGALASCGMEITDHPKSHTYTISTHCCDNVISTYSFCNTFFPTFFNYDNIDSGASLFLYSPSVNISYANPFGSGSNSCESPPGNLLLTDVRLSSICVFRI